MTFTAADDDSGRRLDRVLRKALPGIPLSALYRLFRRRAILVDGRPASGADRVAAGSVIQIPGDGLSPDRAPNRAPAPGRPRRETAAPLPEILFEGEGLLVLNKPAGLAVHGPDRDNLNRRVQTYLRDRIPASLSFRPGPLHRLDKPTSGIVVFSTCLEGAKTFSELLEKGKLVKTYLAVLEGSLEHEELWNDLLFRDKQRRKSLAGPKAAPAAGSPAAGNPAVPGNRARNSREKEALTVARPLCRSNAPGSLTLALVQPKTGRTHQIRSQAALHHFPLWGDRKYGAKGEGGFFLHALSLEFPPEASFPRRITAGPPAAFTAFLKERFGPDIFLSGLFDRIF
ncbi:MAG: RluA family pseudouridine synthase [Treponema sp.]|jgi:23S rRNA pseudouridine955/2504/2580 synthase|nr:RluA family pseudouridine synthase [Treponema sp.]